jgi:hypothetical protein
MVKKLKYRCTHNAGLEAQCALPASQKVDGRWLCTSHLGTTTPLIKTAPLNAARPHLGSGKNATPEERKAYNRNYRREYRRNNPRKRYYVWPIKITDHLWLLGKPTSGSVALYHCDICCEQVQVVRNATNLHKIRKYNSCAYFWVAGTYYRATIGHNCRQHPLVTLRKCDRCGLIGSKNRINSNRHPESIYGDKLCLKCWRTARPFYRLFNEQIELYYLFKDFRKTMRQHDMTPHRQTMPFYYLDTDYREGWYIRGK